MVLATRPGRAAVRVRLLDGEHRGAHEPASQALERFGREPSGWAVDERQPRPLVVAARRERRECLRGQPARPYQARAMGVTN